jgi:hypothetical protein
MRTQAFRSPSPYTPTPKAQREGVRINTQDIADDLYHALAAQLLKGGGDLPEHEIRFVNLVEGMMGYVDSNVGAVGSAVGCSKHNVPYTLNVTPMYHLMHEGEELYFVMAPDAPLGLHLTLDPPASADEGAKAAMFHLPLTTVTMPLQGLTGLIEHIEGWYASVEPKKQQTKQAKTPRQRKKTPPPQNNKGLDTQG